MRSCKLFLAGSLFSPDPLTKMFFRRVSSGDMRSSFST